MQDVTGEATDLAMLQRDAEDAEARAEEARARLVAAHQTSSAARLQPVRAEREALVAERQALDLEIREYLGRCVADARAFYERLCSIATRWDANIRARQSLDASEGEDGFTVPGFEGFVRSRVRKFDNDGRGQTARWARVARAA